MKGAAPTDGPLAMPRPTKNKVISPLLGGGETKESPTPSPLEETNSPRPHHHHPRRLAQAMLHKSAAFSASQPNLAEDAHAAAPPPSLYAGG